MAHTKMNQEVIGFARPHPRCDVGLHLIDSPSWMPLQYQINNEEKEQEMERHREGWRGSDEGRMMFKRIPRCLCSCW